MRLFKRLTTIASAFVLTAFYGAGAGAAPQALGLVATYGDVDLKCNGVECSADFTAFCLQQDRQSPVRGTGYFLVNGEIKLSAMTASGERVDIDAAQHLRMESRRKHLAVRLTLPQSMVAIEGATKVAVNISEGVVLLPETQAGDANPHTQAEVAVLGQQMRAIGTSIVDANPGSMVTARILGDVINGLPERGKSDDLLRQRLWDDAVGRRGGQTPANAIDRARGIYELCRWTAGRGTPNMRDCLETHHDGLMEFLNGQYWKAARPTI